MNDNNERTFTQAELDQIVSDRLKRERDKVAGEQTKREAELSRRERLLTAREDWTRRGLPAEMLDHLDLSKEGALEAAASILERLKPTTKQEDTPTEQLPRFTGPMHGEMRPAADPLRGAFGLNQRKDE